MYRIFIFFSAGHLDYFYVLSIVNSPAKNIDAVSFGLQFCPYHAQEWDCKGLCGNLFFSF